MAKPSRNINPSMPIGLAGYFNIRMWKKILDDIHVRVLVLRQAEQYFALVQFDLITVTQMMVEALYREISDIECLSPDNMIITATQFPYRASSEIWQTGFKP